MPPKKISKQTKKFAKKHLSATIKHRRLKKSNKWGHDKGKRVADEGAEVSEEETVEEQKPTVKAPKIQDVSDLSVESFFDQFDEDEEAGEGEDGEGVEEEEEADGLDEEDAEDEADQQAAVAAVASKTKTKTKTDGKGSTMEVNEDEKEEDEEMDDEAAQLAQEIEEHKQTLEALKAQDPEFYAHMQKEGKQLLQFDEDLSDLPPPPPEGAKGGAAGEQGEEEEEDAVVPDDYTKQKKTAADTMKDVTTATLKILFFQLERQQSMNALRRLMNVFRAACHLGDAEEGQQSSVKIANSKIFNDLMHFCLEKFPGVLDSYVSNNNNSSKGKPASQDKKSKGDSKAAEDSSSSTSSSTSVTARLNSHPQKKFLTAVIKSYLANLLHFTKSLADAGMIRYVLMQCEAVVPFFELFPKLATRFLKNLLEVWADSDQQTRIAAFLRIRQLAIEMPPGHDMLEQALKGSYLTYLRNAKFVSAQSLPIIQFMSNCVVELYSLDGSAAYQHAFVYIRQLAVHLRNALTAKSKDAHKAVYTWQFINCLRVWTKVLCAQGNKDGAPLFPLLYPFLQVCLGVMDLLPVARYFPLKLHVARFVNTLCAACEVYVPLAPHLLSILASSGLNKRVKKTTAKPPDFRYTLKISKALIPTKQFQETAVSAAMKVLLQHFSVFAYSVAFPELVLPTRVFLKRFLKNTHIVRVKKQVQQLLDKLDVNAQWIQGKRNAVDYAPKDLNAKGVSAMATFKPADSVSSSTPVKSKKVKTTDSRDVAPLQRFMELQSQAEREAEEAEGSVEWNLVKHHDKKSKDKGQFAHSKTGKPLQSEEAGSDDEEEDEEGDEANAEEDGEGDEAAEDEDAKASQPPAAKKSKSNTGNALLAAAVLEDGADIPDEVAELVLSDDEDETESKQASKGKTAKVKTAASTKSKASTKGNGSKQSAKGGAKAAPSPAANGKRKRVEGASSKGAANKKSKAPAKKSAKGR